MESNLVDGKFVDQDGAIPENQDIAKSLLERCLFYTNIVLER